MKKPTLRFRQVFEHPTHFKIVKPMGNPMVIAKQGLSQGMQNRLRKYAQGTGEVTPPSPSEQELSQAIMAAEGKTPGEGEFGVPNVAPATPVAPAEIASLVPAAEPAPVPDLEIPAAPVAVVSSAEKPVESATPAAVVVEQPKPVAVVEPAATPVVTPATVVTTPPVATTTSAPVVRTPAEIGEAAKQSYLEEAQKEERASLVQQKLQAIQQEKLAQNAAAEAEQSMLKANQAIQTKIAELAKFDQGKPSTASDIARSIGSALSVAAGAFASGMTGMPNFALQIYNNAIDRDLAKQREQRGSIVNQLQQLGMDQKDAEKYYRSQLDTYTAAQLARMGASTPNPKARAEMIKTAQQIGTNATKAAAEVEQRLAQTKKAEAETKAIPLKTEVEQLDLARKFEADRQDAIQKIRDRASREKISANELAAKLKDIDLDYKAKMAALEKEKPESKGMLNVGGVKIPALNKEGATRIQQNLSARNQAISSATALVDLMENHTALELFNPLSDVHKEALARLQFLTEEYPKGEGFERAISLNAAKVLKEGLQDPTGNKALALQALFGTKAVTPIKSMLRGFVNERNMFVKDMTDPEYRDSLTKQGIERLEEQDKSALAPQTKESKYGAMTPGQVAGQ